MDEGEGHKFASRRKNDLLDLSGGMCSFDRPDCREPGYFGSMTEKIKAAVEGKTVVKFIFVKNKIVNIVVKG